jgi:hypothetical protein
MHPLEIDYPAPDDVTTYYGAYIAVSAHQLWYIYNIVICDAVDVEPTHVPRWLTTLPRINSVLIRASIKVLKAENGEHEHIKFVHIFSVILHKLVIWKFMA